MSSPANPIRLFRYPCLGREMTTTRVVFEYLEASGTFYYKNTSQPQGETSDRQGKPGAKICAARSHPAKLWWVIPGVYLESPELVLFQMNFAKVGGPAPSWPLENFGSVEPLPKAILDLADEVSGWNERSLIDALRPSSAAIRKPRAGDTIEFKPD